MISKVINDKEYLFVEVPEDAVEIYLQECDWQNLMYYKSSSRWHTQDIPTPALPIIIGKASDLNEEQWKGIVEIDVIEDDYTFYKVYCRDADDILKGVTTISCVDVIKSGLSLIASINLKPETTLIILKQ